MAERRTRRTLSTPPPPSSDSPSAARASKTQLTPELTRRIEENRLKAKALRAQHEAAERASGAAAGTLRTPSGYIAGQKRAHSSITSAAPAPNQRDARQAPANGTGEPKAYGDILAARKFTKYVEYDFSKMTDTKGGFLTADDDPHNKALHTPGGREEVRPAHMTVKEWERHQLLKKLREQRAGPFEPGLSVLDDKQARPGCRECGSLEIDWKWAEVFGVRVCNACKERLPEKYSLLTKTEAREDYLLTDPELRDEELMPRLERPNPHKSTWNDMQLFLRFQVEEYAFSARKWGSPEALDAEFERRQADKKRRKEDKFRAKLNDLKKRTRVEAYRKARTGAAAGISGGGGAQFGDKITSRGDRHEHEWGRALTNAEGTTVKQCVECGMEVEELVF